MSTGFVPGPPTRKPRLPATWEKVYIPLVLLCVFIVAAGIAHTVQFIVDKITDVVVHTIGHTPFVGGAITNFVRGLGRPLSEWFGDLATGADRRVSSHFHALAQLVIAVADEIAAISILVSYTAWYVTRKYALPVIEGRQVKSSAAEALRKRKAKQDAARLKKLEQTVAQPAKGKIGAAIEHKVKPVRQREHHHERQTHTERKKVKQQIGRVILPKVDHVTETQTQRQKQTGTLAQRVKRLGLAVFGHGGAAIVGAGLTALGLNWIRCHNWRNIGKQVCRSPINWINDLLGLLTDFLVIENICQILPLLEKAASEVLGPIISVISKAGAGLCHGVQGRETLDAPQPFLPPLQGYSTLHLP